MQLHRLVAIGGGIAAALAFGGMFAVAKSALDSLDAFHLTLARFGIGSLVFLAMLFVMEGRAAFRFEGRAPFLWLLGTIGFAVFNLLAYVGLESTTAQNGALVMATMPMFGVLIGWAKTRKAPGVLQLAFVVLALTGVVLVLTHGDVTSLTSFGSGGFLILIGVSGWVIYSTSVTHYPDWSVLRYTALSCLLGTVSIAAATLAATAVGMLPSPPLEAYADTWWQILYMGIPATALAIPAWNNAIKTLGPTNGILFINLVPVTAFTIEAVKGQQPAAVDYLGAALVLGALVASNFFGRTAVAK